MLSNPKNMTHNYFDLEKDLIQPLKEFLRKLKGEKTSENLEKNGRQLTSSDVFGSHNLNIVKLLKNKKK